MSQPQSLSMDAFKQSSLFSGGNAPYVEAIFEAFLADPNSVDASWRQLFMTLPQVAGVASSDVSHAAIRSRFEAFAQQNTRAVTQTAAAGQADTAMLQRQNAVSSLINAFRVLGHLVAQVEPLGLRPIPEVPELSLSHYGLNGFELQEFDASLLAWGKARATLSDIFQTLKSTYAGSIGAEYMHISDEPERQFIQARLESARGQFNFSQTRQKEILQSLIAADGLERYLAAKFPGTKRFGLEGGDALIPMLDEMIQRMGQQGVKEVVLGMAHRGRLNVLLNIFGKKPQELFDEFAGKHDHHLGSGDVKYHQGFSSDVSTAGGVVHLALAFNPSHLEIVAPVTTGSVKARQVRRKDQPKSQVALIQIHGDAAFAGQGVVMETFNLSQTRGYGIGGTIHIVINNQVGFTTSNPVDARSTRYCTDVAKMVNAPIFHVNTDDPEAVVFITQLAIDYRAQFKKDLVIDLICYRRNGHNEADEPSATQPMMYKLIKSHPVARQLYAKTLIARGTISEQDEKIAIDAYRDLLDKGDCVVSNMAKEEVRPYLVDWTAYVNKDWRDPADTGFDAAQLRSLAQIMGQIPEGLTLHPRVAKIVEDRAKMARGEISLDWGGAEVLAYATLLAQGHPIRLSGQDCGRGTFFHRHAVWHDQNDGHCYIPLQNISASQAAFTVIDSTLSEEAVLGFEYGFASADPSTLVIWEAQFGDFANGAQVLIDQFISSGEQKWGRLAGLAMFLPHGFEGQGPEHSSARLERYLQLCAEHNMQVCVPSTPAQTYHMIRRQMIRKMRRPLIVMTPKSLLRHKLAQSSLEELSSGHFQNVIDEVDDSIDKAAVTRIILCSGKVYYELFEERKKRGIQDIVLARVEQLYPFPEEEARTLLASYPNATEVVWCQEEPENQGAWHSILHHLKAVLTRAQTLLYVGRQASAAPAVGYASLHQEQQDLLVNMALTK